MAEFGCLKEGYLIKQGQNVKSWRKRFFLLQTNVLYYFRSDKDTTSKGFILFKDIIRIDERHTEAHPNIIAIVCRNRTLLLSIDNVVEASSWAQVLRIVFRFYSFQFTYSGGGRTPDDSSTELSLGNTISAPFPSSTPPLLSSDASQLSASPAPSSSPSTISSSATQEGRDTASQFGTPTDALLQSLKSSASSAMSSSSSSSTSASISTTSSAAPIPVPADIVNSSQAGINHSTIWCHSDEYLRSLFDFGKKVLELIVQANGYIRGIASYRKSDTLRGNAMLLGSLGTRLAACLIEFTKTPFSSPKKIEICKVCGEIATMSESVRAEVGDARLLITCLDRMEGYLKMIVAANPPAPQDEIMLAVRKAMLAAEAIVPDERKNRELVVSLGVPKKRAVSTLKRLVDGNNGLLWIGNRFSAVCEGVAVSFLPDSSPISSPPSAVIDPPALTSSSSSSSSSTANTNAVSAPGNDDNISFIQDMNQLTQLAKESYNIFILLANAVMHSRVVKEAVSMNFNPLDLIKDPYVAQCKERFVAYMDTILDIGTRNFIKKT